MKAVHQLVARRFRILACLLVCSLQTACDKSSEAETRAAQEEAFRVNFGFAPPASVTEIQYADHYQRGVVDGTYQEWLRCTYQAEVFDQMVSKNGYKRVGTTIITGPNRPKWWPGNAVGEYVRQGKEGASYVAHLWHDEKTGFVYWHQSWTD